MERKRTTMIIAGAALAGAVAVGGATIAVASSSDDAEEPITGPALDQATAAALDHVGEGQVTETEVGDEDSLYEVEVTLDDGSQIDVQLDADFNVVATEEDGVDDEDDDD